MQHGVINLHKHFREKILHASLDSKYTSLPTLYDIAHAEYENFNDDTCIALMVDKIFEKIKKADENMKDILLGILVVENFKYLYRSSKNVELDIDELSQIVFYKKADNLENIKIKMEKDPDFLTDILFNVIELFYYAPEEEYYFLQKGIKENKLEQKFMEIDKTYVLDKIMYDQEIKYTYESIIEIFKTKFDIMKEDFSCSETALNMIAKQCYTILEVISIYEFETFYNIASKLLTTNYEMIKQSTTKDDTDNLVLLYHISENNLNKIIYQFQSNEEIFINAIKCVLQLNKEKIIQKNPK